MLSMCVIGHLLSSIVAIESQNSTCVTLCGDPDGDSVRNARSHWRHYICNCECDTDSMTQAYNKQVICWDIMVLYRYVLVYSEDR